VSREEDRSGPTARQEARAEGCGRRVERRENVRHVNDLAGTALDDDVAAVARKRRLARYQRLDSHEQWGGIRRLHHSLLPQGGTLHGVGGRGTGSYGRMVPLSARLGSCSSPRRWPSSLRENENTHRHPRRSGAPPPFAQTSLMDLKVGCVVKRWVEV
jgi:hypothetical protein